MMIKRFLLLAALTLVACNGEPQVTRTAHAAVDSPGTVVDSILPVEEEVRRFKVARNGIAALCLENTASSRDELVRRFIIALEHADTAQLRGMVLTAGEFIDLYYPASMFARPPYRQNPELRWFLIQENSNKGLTRLLQRYGGQDTGFQGYSCADQPTIEGENSIWDRCRVMWSHSAAPMRAFSTIIERDGRYKIFSYANDL